MCCSIPFKFKLLFKILFEKILVCFNNLLTESIEENLKLGSIKLISEDSMIRDSFFLKPNKLLIKII